MKDIITLRKYLHSNPDLSGNEGSTSAILKNKIAELNPDEIIEGIGGEGIAFVFKGHGKGKTIIFRSELDALPINETNTFEHRSVKKSVSHKCGHDGHMSILFGLGLKLYRKDFPGSVILLFQPEEETGKGAEKVIEDKKFKYLKPDLIFALHNVPGYKKGTVLIKEKEITAASTGMVIILKGKTTHAASPEKGSNPAFSIAGILKGVERINEVFKDEDRTFATVAGIKSGGKYFGTSAGHAELYLTLRSFTNDGLNKLRSAIEDLIEKETLNHEIDFGINYTEEFISSVNNRKAVSIVENSAGENGLELIILNEPFPWSEDFGRFTEVIDGCFFGIGAGEEHPPLHNDDYDFPDELIVPAVELFHNIILKANEDT